MWYEILKFELQYRKKRPATYLYFVILFLISFLAISTDTVQIGGGAGLVKENAPSTIAFMMVIISAFFMMITSAIMGVGVLRDFEFKTESMMFVNPITKFDYLLGRFLGSFIILIFAFSGSLFGFIMGEFMPWRDADKLLAFDFWNYLQPFLTLVIPNLLFSGIIFFILGAISRKMVVVYSSWIFLFVFYQVGVSMTSDLEDQTIAAMIDPFALNTVQITTQYWTVAEQNSQVIPLAGNVLLNRVLWLVVGLAIGVLGYFSFSFNVVKSTWFKKKTVKTKETTNTQISIPKASMSFGFSTYIRQVRVMTIFYFKQVFKSVPFQAMVLCGMALMIVNSFYIGEVFGTYTYPTTYRMLELINGFNLFFMIILVSYTGELIWKEREANINLIFDAMPMPDFIGLVSKFIGLLLVYVVLLAVLMVTGAAIQASNGYFNFEWGVYFSNLYTDTLFFLILYTLLAMFVQVLVNNKFLGYALMVVFFVTMAALRSWGVEHAMFSFASGNLGTYSDMNGFGHYVPAFSWFNVYWFGLAILLFALSVVFAVRGSEAVMKVRWSVGKLRLTRPMVTFAISAFLIFSLSGCYIFYNTNVLNSYQNSDEVNALFASYEKTLKKYEYLPQPKVKDIKMKVDLMPSQRDYVAEGTYLLQNIYDEPINDVHIQLNSTSNFSYEYARFDQEAILKEEFEDFGYMIYELKAPLMPGDSVNFEFKTMFETKGFEEDGGSTNVVHNGTFINNSSFPSIGYSSGIELNSDDDREDNDLTPKERLMTQEDPRGLSMNMLTDDAINGVNFEIVMSTDEDQIAIAPGYLQREWQEDGRKYFHYKMDVPMEPFFSMVSARYDVMRDKAIVELDSSSQEIDLEIYYHPGHEYNLESMMNAMKWSFEYFGNAFSPYQYRQMRILEFPRYSTFAQSFANTVPFSEGIGFVLKVEDEDDVNVAAFVTAHELAHQWWAHQVIAANVQGSQMIIESLAQYSALMVMKSQYSQEKMQQSLKQELDRYLQGRATEQKKELPLQFVENQQYIHYGKGAVNMYALQDYIGEDSVNLALKRFVSDWSDYNTNGRYSTATDLIGYFREVAPDSMQYVITDLFEKIVLFENKTDQATYQQIGNQYLVNLELSAKKFEADSIGNETEVDLTDWVDVGIYTENSEGNDSLIYIQKHKITENNTKLQIKVGALPSKAGIDPINKLIDRNPDDNTKTVSLAEELSS
ncbi:MAG: M1 family aminopeptidase [Bacteroidota bacterium]